jgi:hypothetical protein
MIGQTLKEVLECDLKGEYNARDLYTRARGICRTHEDLVSMQLFEDLLKDEESHIDFLETQLDLMDKIGVQNYGHCRPIPPTTWRGMPSHPSSRTRVARSGILPEAAEPSDPGQLPLRRRLRDDGWENA